MAQALNPLAFQPEPKAALHARFAAALSPGYLRSVRPQDSPGLNRKHVFDMEEDDMRMVVSLDLADEETRHLMGDAVHFSFGLKPGATPRSVRDFARQAYRLIVEFWHEPVVMETLMTERALHVWCQPDAVVKA